MTYVNLNSPTYALESSASSSSITLRSDHVDKTVFIICNDTANTVFVVSGETAPTAVFPTSATVPVDGKVIPSGQTVAFGKKPGHGFISMISTAADAGKYVYVSVSMGGE